MKTVKIVILSILATLIVCGICTSCKKDNVISPQIYLYDFFLNNKPVETSLIETYPGDTLKFQMKLQPYYDRIVSLKVETDRSYLKDSIFSDKDFKELCDETCSSKSDGIYVFKNMKDNYFLVNENVLIPQKSPGTKTNYVTVIYRFKSSADVSGDYNPSVVKLSFVIKDKE